MVREEPEGGGGLLAVGGHGGQRQPLIRQAPAGGATVTHYSTPPCTATLCRWGLGGGRGWLEASREGTGEGAPHPTEVGWELNKKKLNDYNRTLAFTYYLQP